MTGYCPRCGRELSNVMTDGRGFCEEHGYVFAEWNRPKTVLCSNGCGRAVAVMYDHERENGVTCDDCFERLTVPR